MGVVPTYYIETDSILEGSCANAGILLLVVLMKQ